MNERIFRSRSLKLKTQEPRPTLILNRWVLDGWVARYEWANTLIQSGRECQEFWRDCYWQQQCTNGFFTFWHFKDPWDITESGLTIHRIHKDFLYIHTYICRFQAPQMSFQLCNLVIFPNWCHLCLVCWQVIDKIPNFPPIQVIGHLAKVQTHPHSAAITNIIYSYPSWMKWLLSRDLLIASSIQYLLSQLAHQS